jgi:hypothetical protein
MIISKDDYFKRAENLYGKETIKWKFICPNCKRVQSAETVKAQMESKNASQRHGLINVLETQIYPESECYSSTCNWVAYGLFNSNILVIVDSTKPHSSNTKKNCVYVFPLADDKEMLQACGITK